MDNNLKDLIEMATNSGTISPQDENLILKKGEQQGIEEAEIRLYINASLNKHNANKSETVSPGKNLQFSEFKWQEWMIFISSILVLISGFLPWVLVNSSASGYGQSASYSGSVSGGIFYTIPLTIGALFFLFKYPLLKYRIYYGIFLIAATILALSTYNSSNSFSGSGYSASASVQPGVGILLLFISSLAYLIGSILAKSSKSPNPKAAKNIAVFFLVLFSFCPSLFKAAHEDLNSDSEFIPKLILALILAATPILISRKIKFKNTQNTFLGILCLWILIILFKSTLYFEDSELNTFKFWLALSLNKFYTNNFLGYNFWFLLLALSSIFIDYKQSIQATEQWNKISKFITPITTSVLFFLPILTMTLITFSTKHVVSEEEQKAYFKNLPSGEWYFPNPNNTEAVRLYITHNDNETTGYGSSSEEGLYGAKNLDGMINCKLIAEFEENQSLNLDKYSFAIESKTSYKDVLKAPFKFENTFTINNSTSDKLEGVLTLNDGTKLNITAYNDYESVINQLKTNTTAPVNATTEYEGAPAAAAAAVTSGTGTLTITADKTYFYSEPSTQYKRKAYLVKGQSATFSNEEENFVYVTFESKSGVVTEGWILKSDVSFD